MPAPTAACVERSSARRVNGQPFLASPHGTSVGSMPGISADSNAYWVIGPVALFTKIMIVSFIIFWVRFTYPRFREDQPRPSPGSG